MKDEERIKELKREIMGFEASIESIKITLKIKTDYSQIFLDSFDRYIKLCVKCIARRKCKLNQEIQK
jgi:hypothetical protein